MKYHVNDNGEVKRCRADVKECQFGSTAGREHFDNQEDAIKYAENLNKKEFGTFNDKLRIKEEFAPRQVEHAATEEEIQADKQKNAEETPAEAMKRAKKEVKERRKQRAKFLIRNSPSK